MSDDDQQSPPEPRSRSGRARERVQRRKNKQTQQTTATSTGIPRQRNRPSRQIAPVSQYKLPQIPYLRQITLGVLALGFMGAMILLVGLFKNDPAIAEPNAIWIGEEWTYNTHTDEEIEALVNQLRDHQIGTVYAWVSWLRPNNTWGGDSQTDDVFPSVEPQVQAFVEQFRRAYPEANLYGWIRLQVMGGESGSNLANEDLRDSVSNFAQRITSVLDFDGVFVDANPVFDDDTDFSSLLQRIRLAIGATSDLIVVVPPDWTPIDVDIPTPTVIAQGTVWSDLYKQRIALLADQLVIQAYSSYLTNPAEYSEWVAYQVATYARVMSELGTTSDIIISLPIYENDLPAHDISVENIASALVGIQDGLAQAGETANMIDGLAIYAEWAMQEQDWQAFTSGWLNQD